MLQAAVTDIQLVPNGFLTCGGDGSVKRVELNNHLHGFGNELWYFWDWDALFLILNSTIPQMPAIVKVVINESWLLFSGLLTLKTCIRNMQIDKATIYSESNSTKRQSITSSGTFWNMNISSYWTTLLPNAWIHFSSVHSFSV